jgi:hypothetical protein
MERIIPKGASLEKMVDRYVKSYMFDDDTYDPVESTYRETFQDITTGEYPATLTEIQTSILGKSAVEKTDRGGIMKRVVQGAQFMQRLGVPEGAAIALVATALVAAFPFAIFIIIQYYGRMNKRGVTRLMKDRYGIDYT